MTFWQKTKAFMWKNSPYFLVGAGIAGGICAAVMACKETENLDEVNEKTSKMIEDVHELEKEVGNEVQINGVMTVYTENAYRKDLTSTYITVGWEYAKLYAPSIGVGIASIGCILGGVGILKNWWAASLAAASGIEKMFRTYRDRVIAAEGQAADDRYYYGVETKKKKIKVPVRDENGEIKKDEKGKEIKEEVEVTFVPAGGSFEADGYSQYARMFDDFNSREFDRGDAFHNLEFLKLQQEVANRKLRDRGWLTLNEVYDLLDFENTPEGQVVGWIYDPDGKVPNHIGDNFVDFKFMIRQPQLTKEADKARQDFCDGRLDAVIVDFNVDGVIVDKIGFVERKFRAPW